MIAGLPPRSPSRRLAAMLARNNPSRLPFSTSNSFAGSMARGSL
jgi:hypothetical protein